MELTEVFGSGLYRKTTLKAGSNKMTTHKKTCSYNQPSVIQFRFNTLDLLSSEFVDLLQSVI